jgi:hypothetical protein
LARSDSPALPLVCAGVIAAVMVAVIVDSCVPASASPSRPAVAAVVVPPLPAPPATATGPQPAAQPQPAPAAAPGLVVHNPCQQPLLLAVNVQAADGRRVNEGFFRVAPGARSLLTAKAGPLVPHHGTVHYYTETLETEPVEQGRRTETVGDRELPMKSVELDPPNATTLELECPGSTSGRP